VVDFFTGVFSFETDFLVEAFDADFPALFLSTIGDLEVDFFSWLLDLDLDLETDLSAF
jgi:hypothetical protein